MMMFSREGAPAVSVYPDSDKIAVWTGDSDNNLIFKCDIAVAWVGRRGRVAGRRFRPAHLT
jgi:hypothetical protein